MPTFDIEAAKKAGYSEDEIATFIGENIKMDTEAAKKAGYTTKDILSWMQKNVLRPSLEFGGLAGGAIVGGAVGAPTGPGAALTGVAGAGLGYGIGKKTADIIEEQTGLKEKETIPQAIIGSAQDVAEGALMEVGGQILNKGAQLIGQGAKQILGRLTGTGTGAIEEAVKAGPAFKKAIRGEVSGEEVVEHTRSALGTLKQERGRVYQGELAKLSQKQTPIDITQVKKDMMDALGSFVKIDKAGVPDWSRSALGPEKSEGVKKIQEIVDMINDWGSKEGDTTVLGLDMLKRQLDDFYSPSSNARAFVSNIRNKVKDLIVQTVPEYEKMTKGYADATKIIKDIESNLMLRKEGMSGRIVADQTLRRLVSAMRDNFELRRELVYMLGNKAGQDVAGEVAGHAMSSLVPRGITGTGAALMGQAALAYLVTPKLWPVLMASSPRVAGEFLMVYGKAMQQFPGMKEMIARGVSYKASKDLKSFVYKDGEIIEEK